MSSTIEAINALRKKTGAGIMDCKKALKVSEGDFEQAIAFLRKKGKKILESRTDRDTKEGAIFIDINPQKTVGVMIALGCETDFVAKNSDFKNLGQWINDAILHHFNPHTALDIQTITSFTKELMTVQEKMIEVMGKIGEKITLNDFAIIQEDLVIPYIHTGNTIGTLVGIQGGKKIENIFEIGQNIAMQIAAMYPIAVDEHGVEQHILQKELSIAKAQAQEEGKPLAIIEKIAQGRIKKFLQENTLLNQNFVQDSTLTVQQYLKKINPNLQITTFKRLAIT